ncbi:MAG: histidinol-phosphate transaminase [Firmicutes bacterium]|nr:histidinol-phosphate transaminase [Bacillota bacterium]MDD4264224.1 histidinol-phosphate transaminase [Bacillota bacterium]MDD4693113.1 histidinol-phosphate transaminase [Bacillota bacterium]
MYALRAATTVEENTKEKIKEAMDELWLSFTELNSFRERDIISVIVSSTEDIKAAYPASFIRLKGYENVALLDVTQLNIANQIPLCIRLLIYTTKPGRNLYLRKATKLRPEWGWPVEKAIEEKRSPKPRGALSKIKPYVPGKPIDEVKREYSLEDVIKLASNENPFGPSKKALETMAKKLQSVSLYPDGANYDFKSKLASFYGLDFSQFIVGNGSDELIKLISETYLDEEDNIVIADITFSEYEFGARLMGAGVKKVPLKSFTHDLDGFLREIDERTKLCYICNPNNPTGTIVTHQELEGFLDRLPTNVLVVLDEAYAEYAENPKYPDFKKLIDSYPLIVLRTFSKIYGLAGLRVGVGIAGENIISSIEKTREPFNVNLLAQAAAISSLEDIGHRDFCFRENASMKREFYNKCKAEGIEYVESEASFVLIRVERAKDIVQEMLKKGVIVRSAASFGLDDYIRVSLGTKQQMEKFWNLFTEIRDGGISK